MDEQAVFTEPLIPMELGLWVGHFCPAHGWEDHEEMSFIDDVLCLN